ncbi:DUF4012 domain-containing protein, partial [Patescibacteria group bacterium]|nr:DUF4012 domain-containing protein [Patescibacteria group bacterium]
ANWYLRDSNWDPDFPTSASRAQWFLEKTLETEVQGTIAVNVYSLASLLDALGPVSLLDYQEEVTASNIFERAEYHAEVNFFPGSTQKKEFLSSVADALFSRLSSLGEDQALPVARALAEGLDEKNTLLSVSTPASDHAFSALGWNGELRTPPCPILDQTCYSDYAMLVDSNLGVNKANYFLRRSLALDVTISDKLALSHLLTVQYQNTSTSGAWPAGTYKNYSRLYLPEGAIFDSLKVDGITLGEEAVSLSAEHGRTVVGFLVQVPINSSVKVELAYRLSHSLLQEGATYSLYWQKQPGTAPDPLTITLNYPLFMKPDLVSPQADLKEQQLQFNLSNITDRRVTVKFK